MMLKNLKCGYLSILVFIGMVAAIPKESEGSKAIETGPRCLTTNDSPDKNAECIFPWKFSGITLNECTYQTDPDGRYWCSTKVDTELEHVAGQGNWGFCRKSCPPISLVTTTTTLKPTTTTISETKSRSDTVDGSGDYYGDYDGSGDYYDYEDSRNTDAVALEGSIEIGVRSITQGNNRFPGVSGCKGEAVVEPRFGRGDIIKENEDGFGKLFKIRCNKNKDGCRTNNIEIKGTCCWKIFDRRGNSQEFTPGQDKEPTIAYISKLKTKKCV